MTAGGMSIASVPGDGRFVYYQYLDDGPYSHGQYSE
jgi:hypothetical protein